MISAKHTSFAGMLFSFCWICVLTILKGLGEINLTIQDIIYSGAVLTAIFSPVFVSIWLEKIKEIRSGGLNS